MSEAKPKRAPRESARGNGAGAKAKPAESAEVLSSPAPETATAAVALETAIAREPASKSVGEPSRVESQPKGKPISATSGSWADPWAAWSDAQSALARGFEDVAMEATSLTRSGFEATTEATKAVLGAKTFAEVVEINAGFARRSFDATLAGAAKLSEIGVKAATDASRPILNRLGETWKNLGAR